MESQQIFSQLANFESALAKKPALKAVLQKSMDELSAAQSFSTLQQEFLIVTFAHFYHHFGFCAFSPLARSLLVEPLSNCAGVPESVVELWLESLCYQILEDFNVLKIVSGEPNWQLVNEAFARDVVKRLLCSEFGERFHLGLSVLDQDWVREMYDVATKRLGRENNTGKNGIEFKLTRVKHGTAFRDAFSQLVVRLSENPLLLLAWRLESFSAFSEAGDEARFFIRREGSQIETIASRYAATLAILLPHHNASGKPLLHETPVTLNEMVKLFREPERSAGFDLSVLRNWLGVHDRELNAMLSNVLRGATRAGLIFEIALRKTQKAYGLTRMAQTIVGPFHAAITQTLQLSASNEEGAPETGTPHQSSVAV